MELIINRLAPALAARPTSKDAIVSPPTINGNVDRPEALADLVPINSSGISSAEGIARRAKEENATPETMKRVAVSVLFLVRCFPGIGMVSNLENHPDGSSEIGSISDT